MHINVSHVTTYHYEEPPKRIIQMLRLTPRAYDGQAVSDWQIDLNCDADLIEKTDPYGNYCHLLTVETPPIELVITAGGRIDTENMNGIVSGITEPLDPLTYCRDTELTRANGAIVEFAEKAAGDADTDLARTHALLAALNDRIEFSPGATDSTTTAIEAFEQGHGVCQDLAHLFCAASRSLDIPARYVSGHLLRSDGENRQPAAHAWAEAWISDLGWVAFDPANGISADENYIRIAVGPDYRAAAPMVGNRVGGGMETLRVDVLTEPGRSRQRQSQSQSSGSGSQSQSQSQSGSSSQAQGSQAQGQSQQ